MVVHDEDPNQLFSAVHVFACFPATALLRRAGLEAPRAVDTLFSSYYLGECRPGEFRSIQVRGPRLMRVLVLIRKNPHLRRT